MKRCPPVPAVGTYVEDLAPSQAGWTWVQHRYLASDGNGEKWCPSESFCLPSKNPWKTSRSVWTPLMKGRRSNTMYIDIKIHASDIRIYNTYNLVVRFHVKLVGHNSNQKSIIHQVFHPQIYPQVWQKWSSHCSGFQSSDLTKHVKKQVQQTKKLWKVHS